MERKLAAIMIADVVGFSRLMEQDESRTFERVRKLREEISQQQVIAHGGRTIKTTGDGFLAEFPSAGAALKAGIAIQKANAEREAEQPDEDRIQFRIGINSGDIIIDGEDIAGDGVNIAARLEPLSPPDGLCISQSIRDQIRDDLEVYIEDMGEQKLKNIERSVRAFSVVLASQGALSRFSVAKPVRGFGGRPAIAVLPFDNMSNDPEQDFFADGIAEDILTRLAMWRWMPVIGRNSSFTYRGKAVDLKKVGMQLGARYILEGSVRKSGDRVRITGQLIDTETGHHVWAQKYDRILEDIFALQDEITEAIVAALEPAVGQAERSRAVQKGTRNLDAWDLFQRGQWHFARLTRGSFIESYASQLAAAEKDSQFSTPLAGAAFVRQVEAMFAWRDPIEAIGDSYRLASAAIQRDPLDPWALTALGVACLYLGQYEAAIEHCTKSVELNPSSSLGQYGLGFVRNLNGQPDKALLALETAIRLSPNDFNIPNYLGTLSTVYYMKGDYEKACEVARHSILNAPTYPHGHRCLANALGKMGRLAEGRQSLEAFLKISPGYRTSIARQTARFSKESDFDNYMDGLRKLGWDGSNRANSPPDVGSRTALETA